MIRPEMFKSRWTVLILLWAAAVCLGGTLLWRYAATAGIAASPPQQWPAGLAIAREPGRSSLVFLAHPRCPCTRASLTELAVLMSRVGQTTSAHVLFIRPRGVDGDWEKTALWQSAAAIPGVTVHSDPGGAQAALFRAVTSGQVVVYDPNGRLAFHGGITGARGHEGDNLGLDRALAWLSGGHADKSESNVFGCSLDSREPKGSRTP